MQYYLYTTVYIIVFIYTILQYYIQWKFISLKFIYFYLLRSNKNSYAVITFHNNIKFIIYILIHIFQNIFVLISSTIYLLYQFHIYEYSDTSII